MKTTSWRIRSQGGAVAIIAAISLPVLVGFAGLAIDIGRLYVTKTELQNAADACALAAARELTCDPAAGACGTNFLINAENAAIAVGQRNKVGFQSTAVTVQPGDVKFSTVFSPNSNYISRGSGASTSSKFVMCTLPLTGIVPLFMQVLGAGAQTVSSEAVASLAPSQTNCAIPLGICTQGGGAPSYGLTPGQWYSSKFDPGGPNDPTGNFNWIDFNPGSPTPGCSGGGAGELACIIQGAGACSLPSAGTQVGQTGAANSLSSAWNTRFGLYQGGGGVSTNDLTGAVPDSTGFSYNPTSWPNAAPQNALSGTASSGTSKSFRLSRESHDAFQGPGLPGYSSASSTQLSSYGADRRLAIAPIVDCAGWTTSQTRPVLAYACVLLLNPFKNPGDDVRLEYEGLASAIGSPCATTGLPGGPGSAGPSVPVLLQ